MRFKVASPIRTSSLGVPFGVSVTLAISMVKFSRNREPNSAVSPTSYSDRTARISLFDANMGEVSSWSLRNVYPAAWHGPNLDAKDQQVAIETLQLIHEGFL